MQTVTADEITLAPRVQELLRKGEEVAIAISGLSARLVPDRATPPKSEVVWPNLAARHQAIFGNAEFSADDVVSWREVEREPEEG